LARAIGWQSPCFLPWRRASRAHVIADKSG
jgi:hypothetical protein